jgi:hypothetical protein
LHNILNKSLTPGAGSIIEEKSEKKPDLQDAIFRDFSILAYDFVDRIDGPSLHQED